jgi:predicted phage baseplate assembly protein
LNVEDANGRTGTAGAQLSDFDLAASGSNDPTVSEYALVASVSSTAAPYPHTQILLQSTLINCYDRTTAAVNANVGPATNGQSVSEILGSGSASTPNQSFTLKQSPLTFVSAPTPSSRQSTLQVTVSGVTWTGAPTLYQQGPSQQVYATLNQPGGAAEVFFGDGVQGATLPTGQNNVQASYRIGLGSAGNVAAGSLTTLMDRPLGVNGVTNPETAAGGQDPDSVDDIRANAPQSVLTLGRGMCCKNDSVGDQTNLFCIGHSAFQPEGFPDEQSLPQYIRFRQPSHLALPDHMHHFVTLYRSPSSIERSKTLAGIHPPFDRSMILFHNII